MTQKSNKNCCKVDGCEEIARYGTVNKETGVFEKHHCEKHQQNGEIRKSPPWKDRYDDTCIIYRSLGFIITINKEIWKKECTGQNFKPPINCWTCKNPIENPTTINNLTRSGFHCPHCVAKKRKQQQNGRPQNKGFTCDGSCGNKDCKQTFKKSSELKIHQEARLKKYNCPIPDCPKHTEGYGRLADMCVHFRDIHKELCETDGSCPQYGVKPRGTTRLIKPKKYDKFFTDAQWYHLKESIRMNINSDKKRRWDNNKEDQEYTLKINNEKIHKLTEQVADILIERNMIKGPCTDDAGGYLPNGFVLDSHALYKLSLDRKDNNRPHFLPNTDNVLENLSLIIIGMNTSTSIVAANREDTCEYVREKVKESRTKTKEDEDKLIELQRKTARKIKRRQWIQCTLYGCSFNVFIGKKTGTRKFKDENCREEFKTANEFFKYCHSILEAQRGYCAISGIFLQTELSGPRSPFKLSVDAIKPRLGHVRGNIRIICQFLNSTNHDKTKNYENEDDNETAWTKELFEEYFQINEKCV